MAFGRFVYWETKLKKHNFCGLPVGKFGLQENQEENHYFGIPPISGTAIGNRKTSKRHNFLRTLACFGENRMDEKNHINAYRRLLVPSAKGTPNPPTRHFEHVSN